MTSPKGGSPSTSRAIRLSIEQGESISAALSEERTWTQVLRGYRQSSTGRSLFELAITALPLATLWSVAWLIFSLGYWWVTILVTFPAAGFLVRLFMIQHDCGHGSFCPNRWANDWVGRSIGVLTLTPYDFWRRTHAIHHATSGNLDHRGIGDVDILTVREYLASSRWGRWKYRLYRNPLVLFVLGPVYVFLLRHRLPFGLMRGGWQPWISTQATNAAIASIAALLIWLIGIKAFLLVHLPIMLFAAMFGVWLFYVQHQFENTFWDGHQRWDLHKAALHGSSYYDLPQPLRWFTANIGIHHVHHLCSRIPYYRLPNVLRDHPEFRYIGRLTLMQSFLCVRLALWDESQRRLISFRELRAASACGIVNRMPSIPAHTGEHSGPSVCKSWVKSKNPKAPGVLFDGVDARAFGEGGAEKYIVEASANDELKYPSPPSSTGAAFAELVWKRVK